MKRKVTIDGDEAAAYVAHKTSDVVAIYSAFAGSPMGVLGDQWSSECRANIWGAVPTLVEMQSNAGVAGTLQVGALTTTIIYSQGLLMMIPNMYKIARESTPYVMHVAARSISGRGLSSFGEHQDVMAVRTTGWALLSSNSVQEVMDFSLIAQAATLKSHIPFLHFYDGFGTSHEIAEVEQLDIQEMLAMIPEELMELHRQRACMPLDGAAQNPEISVQAGESDYSYHLALPAIVQKAMDRFAGVTGRQYQLYEYSGAPDADRVIVLMGSGAKVVQDTVEKLRVKGERVGILKVRLYRPFASDLFLQALPQTVKSIAVLDRTTESGSAGEPLYSDVLVALAEGAGSGESQFKPLPKVIGGRYGLSSIDFTSAMVRGVFNELARTKSKNHFTIGIMNDVPNTSNYRDSKFSSEVAATVCALKANDKDIQTAKCI